MPPPLLYNESTRHPAEIKSKQLIKEYERLRDQISKNHLSKDSHNNHLHSFVQYGTADGLEQQVIIPDQLNGTESTALLQQLVRDLQNANHGLVVKVRDLYEQVQHWRQQYHLYLNSNDPVRVAIEEHSAEEELEKTKLQQRLDESERRTRAAAIEVQELRERIDSLLKENTENNLPLSQLWPIIDSMEGDYDRVKVEVELEPEEIRQNAFPSMSLDDVAASAALNQKESPKEALKRLLSCQDMLRNLVRLVADRSARVKGYHQKSKKLKAQLSSTVRRLNQVQSSYEEITSRALLDVSIQTETSHLLSQGIQTDALPEPILPSVQDEGLKPIQPYMPDPFDQQGNVSQMNMKTMKKITEDDENSDAITIPDEAPAVSNTFQITPNETEYASKILSLTLQVKSLESQLEQKDAAAADLQSHFERLQFQMTEQQVQSLTEQHEKELDHQKQLLKLQRELDVQLHASEIFQNEIKNREESIKTMKLDYERLEKAWQNWQLLRDSSMNDQVFPIVSISTGSEDTLRRQLSQLQADYNALKDALGEGDSDAPATVQTLTLQLMQSQCNVRLLEDLLHADASMTRSVTMQQREIDTLRDTLKRERTQTEVIRRQLNETEASLRMSLAECEQWRAKVADFQVEMEKLQSSMKPRNDITNILKKEDFALMLSSEELHPKVQSSLDDVSKAIVDCCQKLQQQPLHDSSALHLIEVAFDHLFTRCENALKIIPIAPEPTLVKLKQALVKATGTQKLLIQQCKEWRETARSAEASREREVRQVQQHYESVLQEMSLRRDEAMQCASSQSKLAHELSITILKMNILETQNLSDHSWQAVVESMEQNWNLRDSQMELQLSQTKDEVRKYVNVLFQQMEGAQDEQALIVQLASELVACKVVDREQRLRLQRLYASLEARRHLMGLRPLPKSVTVSPSTILAAVLARNVDRIDSKSEQSDNIVQEIVIENQPLKKENFNTSPSRSTELSSVEKVIEKQKSNAQIQRLEAQIGEKNQKISELQHVSEHQKQAKLVQQDPIDVKETRIEMRPDQNIVSLLEQRIEQYKEIIQQQSTEIQKLHDIQNAAAKYPAPSSPKRTQAVNGFDTKQLRQLRQLMANLSSLHERQLTQDIPQLISALINRPWAPGGLSQGSLNVSGNRMIARCKAVWRSVAVQWKDVMNLLGPIEENGDKNEWICSKCMEHGNLRGEEAKNEKAKQLEKSLETLRSEIESLRQQYKAYIDTSQHTWQLYSRWVDSHRAQIKVPASDRKKYELEWRKWLTELRECLTKHLSNSGLTIAADVIQQEPQEIEDDVDDDEDEKPSPCQNHVDLVVHDALRASYAQLQNMVQHLQKRITDLTERQQVLSQQNTTARQEITLLQRGQVDRDDEIKRLRSEMQRKEKLNGDMSIKLNNLERQQKQKEENFSEMEIRLKSLQQKNLTKDSSLEALRQRCVTLQSHLNALQNDYKHVCDRAALYGGVNNRLKELEKRYQDVVRRSSATETKSKDWEQKYSALQVQLQEKKRQELDKKEKNSNFKTRIEQIVQVWHSLILELVSLAHSNLQECKRKINQSTKAGKSQDPLRARMSSLSQEILNVDTDELLGHEAYIDNSWQQEFSSLVESLSWYQQNNATEIAKWLQQVHALLRPLLT